MQVRAANSSLLRDIQHQVASKQRSAVEVATTYLRQLRSVEGSVDSFITVDEDHVLAQVSVMAWQTAYNVPAMSTNLPSASRGEGVLPSGGTRS